MLWKRYSQQTTLWFIQRHTNTNEKTYSRQVNKINNHKLMKEGSVDMKGSHYCASIFFLWITYIKLRNCLQLPCIPAPHSTHRLSYLSRPHRFGLHKANHRSFAWAREGILLNIHTKKMEIQQGHARFEFMFVSSLKMSFYCTDRQACRRCIWWWG